jgi:hypothetical protein
LGEHVTREEYETLRREKAELEAEFRMLIYEEWNSVLQELGLPENSGLWEA